MEGPVKGSRDSLDLWDRIACLWVSCCSPPSLPPHRMRRKKSSLQWSWKFHPPTLTFLWCRFGSVWEVVKFLFLYFINRTWRLPLEFMLFERPEDWVRARLETKNVILLLSFGLFLRSNKSARSWILLEAMGVRRGLGVVAKLPTSTI